MAHSRIMKTSHRSETLVLSTAPCGFLSLSHEMAPSYVRLYLLCPWDGSSHMMKEHFSVWVFPWLTQLFWFKDTLLRLLVLWWLYTASQLSKFHLNLLPCQKISHSSVPIWFQHLMSSVIHCWQARGFKIEKNKLIIVSFLPCSFLSVTAYGVPNVGYWYKNGGQINQDHKYKLLMHDPS